MTLYVLLLASGCFGLCVGLGCSELLFALLCRLTQQCTQELTAAKQVTANRQTDYLWQTSYWSDFTCFAMLHTGRAAWENAKDATVDTGRYLAGRGSAVANGDNRSAGMYPHMLLALAAQLHTTTTLQAV